MIYFHKELKEKLGSDYQIKKALKDRVFFKVEEGLYSDKQNENYLNVIMKKFPYGVVYGESAYYYYGFTDFIPNKITLATSQNNTIRSNHIKQVRLTDNLYNLGKTTISYNGVQINIYDRERMLLELARNKNSMGYDLYKEIVSNYRKIVDELNMEKVEKYLNYYTSGDKLFEIIQDEVF